MRHGTKTVQAFTSFLASLCDCAAEVEVVALLLLHMREDVLIRQLEVDPKLRKWLKKLLLQLPSAYDCYSAEAYPLTQTTQKLLLRVFLRLAKLQLVNLKVQQLLSLPSTACMDICLCWEVADPNLCREVAFTLLTSLKPTKRQRLIVELRESVLRALDVAAKRLDAINKRPDCPVLCPLLSAAQADHTSSSWQAATAGALQHLIEVLSTLRVATCCLPVSFALELWERRQDKDSSHPTIEAMLNALRRPEAPKIVEAPFAALLRRVYAKLLGTQLPKAAQFGRSSVLETPEDVVGGWSSNQVIYYRIGALRFFSYLRSADEIDYVDSILASPTHSGDALVPTCASLAAPSEKKEMVWVLNPTDAATVKQLQEMLPDHGPGFLYLALRELRGNADEVVSFLVEKMKPAALRSVPLKATLQDAAEYIEREEKGAAALSNKILHSGDIERQVLALAERAAEEVLQGSEDSGGSLYDDDADDDLLGDAVTTPWNPAESQEEESSSSRESTQEDATSEQASRGGRMPVRGGTLLARRKETNKADVGNHSRRNQ
ncbi:hypothetical protein, conserved [Eimeria tenella]|uniref:CUE domain-containing protein n=1 Tax=Eimeria tenella TaxID=5802 RepID=U6KR73_EIMTE|nr:hypothetical protein, conserved [Eimeria tenella]CDJ40446.1 hypothetical protein, conserved [Eimeria tenella]|eukprot:XP_013231196.1 hypothetical protein, conserved [Eimeria tenella]